MRFPFRTRPALVLALFLTLWTTSDAQLDQDFEQMLLWRNIGPYRGGRTLASQDLPAPNRELEDAGAGKLKFRISKGGWGGN